MQATRVLRYAETSTRVGRILVVMSRNGVVDVVLAEQGMSPGEFLRSARSRFPSALLVPDDGAHGSWAAAAVARIDGARLDFALPIDLRWSAPSSGAGMPALVAYAQCP